MPFWVILAEENTVPWINQIVELPLLLHRKSRLSMKFNVRAWQKTLLAAG